jgi:hypothetical protein
MPGLTTPRLLTAGVARPTGEQPKGKAGPASGPSGCEAALVGCGLPESW